MASSLSSGSLMVGVLPWVESAVSTSSKPTLMSLSLCSTTTVRTAGLLSILSRARRWPAQPRANLFSSVHSCQTTQCRVFAETGNLPPKIDLLIITCYSGVERLCLPL